MCLVSQTIVENEKYGQTGAQGADGACQVHQCGKWRPRLLAACARLKQPRGIQSSQTCLWSFSDVSLVKIGVV